MPYFSPMKLYGLLALVLLSACGVQRYERAYLDYNLTIHHPDSAVSAQLKHGHSPNMRVTIQGDTAMANYFYGHSMLTTILIQQDTGWAMLKMDQQRYKAELSESDIDTLLGLSEWIGPIAKNKGWHPCGKYRCRIAEGLLADGSRIKVWYRPKHQLENVNYPYAFERLKGLPVQFEITKGPLRFEYQLDDWITENTRPVRVLLPSQYTTIPADSLLQMSTYSLDD